MAAITGTIGTIRPRAHAIEAQALFVPALADVLAEAGLDMCGFAPGADLHRLMDEQPDVLFVDSDYIPDPLGTIRSLRTLVPGAAICVYSSRFDVEWSEACRRAGATALLGKDACRELIVSGLREALCQTRAVCPYVRGRNESGVVPDVTLR